MALSCCSIPGVLKGAPKLGLPKQRRTIHEGPWWDESWRAPPATASASSRGGLASSTHDRDGWRAGRGQLLAASAAFLRCWLPSSCRPWWTSGALQTCTSKAVRMQQAHASRENYQHSSAPKANLVYSEGFAKRFLLCLGVAFYITHGAAATLPGVQQASAWAYDWLLDRLMHGAAQLMWWSVFALLSSSCCALQLILNIFSFGCAGFNTYLGPARPLFLALTVALQVKVWQAAWHHAGMASTPPNFLLGCMVTTTLTLVASFLPEITDRFNRSRTARLKQASMKVAVERSPARAVLHLEGLGCVACVNAVQNALDNVVQKFVDEVASYEVSLERKEARIEFSCGRSVAEAEAVPALVSAINDAGFDASVKSLTGSTTSNESEDEVASSTPD